MKAMKLMQKDGTMSEYIPGGFVDGRPTCCGVKMHPCGGVVSNGVDLEHHWRCAECGKVNKQVRRELTEAEQNLPLSERNPKRVSNVKKIWKLNKFGGWV